MTESFVMTSDLLSTECRTRSDDNIGDQELDSTLNVDELHVNHTEDCNDSNDNNNHLSPHCLINSLNSSHVSASTSPQTDAKERHCVNYNELNDSEDSFGGHNKAKQSHILSPDESSLRTDRRSSSDLLSDQKSDNNLYNICLNTESNDNNVSHLRRVDLDEQTIMSLTSHEFRHHWNQQKLYIDYIEYQLRQLNRDKSDLISLRESEERLKHQQLEANRRENVLVMRLTTKEQEMQEYLNQIQELKQSQVPSKEQLQSTLLDPAVNLMFAKMKKEVDSSRAKVDEMQNELNAWKFTPDSTTGKRLMSKCRLLYQENEELGKMIESGRIAKLEGELSLQRNFSEELKKSQSEMDEFLLELDEDVEGMQNTIYYLQQQLKEAKEKLSRYESNKIQQNSCVHQNNNNLTNNSPNFEPTLDSSDNHSKGVVNNINLTDDNTSTNSYQSYN
ncbi:pre-mRNA-splicing regulator WTAP-like [Oppia nitens]|uniref:pre-mRNA-splicing regulator WTAP-like n=1 Tax=Oppia nitens TaxID=1686743 RepID=UPI0023DBCC40|nr:pre-mRNA-splicing regulator WTAP-like [Oppia nitens]